MGIPNSEIPIDLNTATGETFARSGAELEVTKEFNLPVRMGFGGHNLIDSVVILADHISQDWTPTQAELMSITLNASKNDIRYTDIAKTVGKSRQTVTKSLIAAGDVAISLALRRIERGYAQ